LQLQVDIFLYFNGGYATNEIVMIVS